ncbi:MAG: glycosyltransferase family 2 protein [Flavobacteriales bacterium]|nr:glycosyltransferase family 2 protein [Flavobacteriales bacterium]MBK9536433.1 glycosyltransferase family 2 protein [Flavobacteriales bacterium]MBP9137336.1 glycosyltransferase family 2 protein [Flavobacteriales bacterium]HQV50680.1 glycosyltransferase family A protein [Flavobacteriales bacterium]HQX28756.1 glycosyltransferase family A protein [Flavobacteriales bacterium]
MTMPLVSVIIPAYNAERWIDSTLRSTLEQSIHDIEVILVDDGSSDGTTRIASGINDPRLRIIKQPNQGVSSARNTGIEHAKGTYFRFLDADDLMLPNDIEVKIATLNERNVDWVFSDALICNADSELTGETLKGTDGDVAKTILLGLDPAVPTAASNLLAHRRCFDAGVRFDTDLSNAADQGIALTLARSFSYAHVQQGLFLYRVHSTSMSRNLVLYQNDHLRLLNKAHKTDPSAGSAFWNVVMANAYWAIGGSWWVNGKNRVKAIPWLIRAWLKKPGIVLRSKHKAMTRRMALE